LPKGKVRVWRLWPAFIESAHDFGIGVVWPGVEPVQRATCLDLNLLRSAGEQPYQECFGRELYPTLSAKAAYLFIHIAGGHIFSNGNKRTAVLCLDTFLMANSRYLTLSNTFIRKMAENVASAGERNEKFSKVLDTVTRVIERGTIPVNALRAIDMEEYRSILRQKRWIRTDPLNRKNARLAQRDRG
jgi:death on curing protein